jgi:hypothetical protein
MPSLLLSKKPAGNVLAVVQGGRNAGMLVCVSDEPGRSHIDLHDGFLTFEPPHDPKQRFILATMASSGAGKSTQIALCAQRYHTLYPRRPIVLMSRLDEDETLDQLPYIRRINVNSLLDNPFDLKELQDCLLIIDDVEGLPIQLEKAVQQVLELVLTQGRHTNTSLLYSAHNLTSGNKTRTLLNEAHAYLVFPHATSMMQLKYLLERYAGLDRKEIAAIRKLPSRWVCITRRYPTAIFGEHEAFLPHSE